MNRPVITKCFFALVTCVGLLIPTSSRANDKSFCGDMCVRGGVRPPRPLMPNVEEACSFLVGDWNGVADDGTKFTETWMPILNNSTVGVRASAARNYEVFEIYSDKNKVPHLRMRVSGPDSASAEFIDGTLDAHSSYPNRIDFVFKTPAGQIKGVGFSKVSDDQIRQTSHCGEGTPIVQKKLTRVTSATSRP